MIINGKLDAKIHQTYICVTRNSLIIFFLFRSEFCWLILLIIIFHFSQSVQLVCIERIQWICSMDDVCVWYIRVKYGLFLDYLALAKNSFERQCSFIIVGIPSFYLCFNSSKRKINQTTLTKLAYYSGSFILRTSCAVTFYVRPQSN